jgi:hypothetical protein
MQRSGGDLQLHAARPTPPIDRRSPAPNDTDHMPSIRDTFRTLLEQRRRRRARLPWAELEAEAVRQECSPADIFFDRAGRSVPGLPHFREAHAAELAPIGAHNRAGYARKPTYDTWGRRS